MKKIVKLTEADLVRIVKLVIREQDDNDIDELEGFVDHLRDNRDQLDVAMSHLATRFADNMILLESYTVVNVPPAYMTFLQLS